MKVCAIYARVSDASQLLGESLGHQISFAREYARRRSSDEREPWMTPESCVYVDEGVTGTSLVKRPEIQRLIRDARAGAFQVVLFKGISRFARDTVDALLMLRTLTACRVRVISMEENYDSQRDSAEFVFTIHSALAQAESEKTAIRVRMGAAEKAKSGKWNGRAPDGYVLNPKTQRLEIDKTMAPLIRDIFAMYLNGLGCRTIVETLNREGRFTKQGNLWTQRNIARLLRNPVYAGDVVYGRREKRLAPPDDSDPLVRRKHSAPVQDEGRIVVCWNAHRAIIHRDTFLKAQELLAGRKRTPGRTGKMHILTKGMIACTCGSNMTIKYNGHGTAYYRCIRQADRGRTACNANYIRAEDAERAVLQRVRADMQSATRSCDLHEIRFEPDDSELHVQELQAEIERQMTKSEVLFERYSDGHLLEEQYVRMNDTIKGRLKALQTRREVILAERQNQGDMVSPEQRIRAALNELLQVHSKDAAITRALLSLLVERVQVVQCCGQSIEVKITYRFKRPECAEV